MLKIFFRLIFENIVLHLHQIKYQNTRIPPLPSYRATPTLIEGGGARSFRNTSPFLGLHARARDAPHQFTDEGRSAPVHGRKKKSHAEGTHT